MGDESAIAVDVQARIDLLLEIQPVGGPRRDCRLPHGRSRAARAPAPRAPRDRRRRAPAHGRLDAALRAAAAQPDPQADRGAAAGRPGAASGRAGDRAAGAPRVHRRDARRAGRTASGAAEPRRGRAAPYADSPARTSGDGWRYPRGRRRRERHAVGARRATGVDAARGPALPPARAAPAASNWARGRRRPPRRSATAVRPHPPAVASGAAHGRRPRLSPAADARERLPVRQPLPPQPRVPRRPPRRVRRPGVQRAGGELREEQRDDDLRGRAPRAGRHPPGRARPRRASCRLRHRISSDSATCAGSRCARLYASLTPDARRRRRPAGIPGSRLTGPWPVGQYAAALRERLRAFPRVQVFGEVFSLRVGRARVWFELRDERGALPCSMWRQDFDALGRAARRRAAGRRRGRLRLLPGLAGRVAGVLLRGRGAAHRRRGRPARPARAAAARARTPRACSRRRRRCARPALPRCIGVVTGEHGKARDDVLAGAAPARLGGPPRVGVRARAGPPRRAGRHPRAAGPRRLPGGRGHHRRPRRRLARRPVRVLRRDAVPHGRAAAGARDRLGRPPHRPDADRRRRRGVLLDADARRRGGRAGRLPRGARGAARARRAARPPGPPRDRPARADAHDALPRAGASTSPATAPGCTSTRASCARARPARLATRERRARRRRRRLDRRAGAVVAATRAAATRAAPTPRRSTAARGAPPRRAPSARAPRARARRPRSRSARSSAATRWSRTAPARRSRPPPRPRGPSPRSRCASPTAPWPSAPTRPRRAGRRRPGPRPHPARPRPAPRTEPS